MIDPVEQPDVGELVRGRGEHVADGGESGVGCQAPEQPIAEQSGGIDGPPLKRDPPVAGERHEVRRASAGDRVRGVERVGVLACAAADVEEDREGQKPSESPHRRGESWRLACAPCGGVRKRK